MPSLHRLLSRCDTLLKCTSAVGEFAVYFNPAIRCIDMNLKLRHAPSHPPLPQHRGVNPTQRTKVVFHNTHARVLWPWGGLLACRFMPQWLVAWVWRLCAERLRFGLRCSSA